MTRPAAAEIVATRRDFWRAVLIGQALAALILCLMYVRDVPLSRFHDPDDAMRLLEVRDWLAGQSWWDVSQHRLGGGTTFAMHWSRLIDLPIAAVIDGLTPLVGAAAATSAALIFVPLLTLFFAILLAAALTLRLNAMPQVRTAILLVPISTPLLAQLQPGRIDHHGWQIVLALAATLALATRSTWRSGMLAGLALGTLITISFEGLPFALAAVVVASIAWAIDPTRRGQAIALTATFAAWAVVLQIATRGPGFWRPACDAVAPAWLAALIVAALTFVAITALPMRSRVARLATLAVPGIASGAVAIWLAPDCILGGPFAMLDPFVRHWWFDNVPEGLPIWRQPINVIVPTYALPVLGMIGSVLALRRADGERRDAWRMTIALQGCAFVLALLVLRAGGTANALAIPGAAVLATAALDRARKIDAIVPRTLATLGTYMLVAPSIVFLAVVVLWPDQETGGRPVAASAKPACTSGDDVGALAELAPARLFAPLDIGPELLLRTRHQAVSSGYHRNNDGMHLVMAAFMGSPEAARRAVARTGTTYVVGCPGTSETDLYDQVAPNGFWARLERGERFDWLQPVPIRGSPVLAWRVLPRAPPRR